MELIAARLSHHIDNTARMDTFPGRKRAGLDIELLQCIRKRVGVIHGYCGSHVVYSIEEPVGTAARPAANTYRKFSWILFRPGKVVHHPIAVPGHKLNRGAS